MTQIDTKTLLDEIAGIAITTNGKPHIPRTLRDELVTHLLDTAPLSREELETVLKEAGFEQQWNKKTFSKLSKFENQHQWVNLEEDCVVFNIDVGSISFDYSAICRRLLRDLGVIA